MRAKGIGSPSRFFCQAAVFALFFGLGYAVISHRGLPTTKGAKGNLKLDTRDSLQFRTASFPGTSQSSPEADGAARASVLRTINARPLAFELNYGQSDGRVKFLARGNGYALFLTNDEAVLELQKAEGRKQNAENENRNSKVEARSVQRTARDERGTRDQGQVAQNAVLRMKLLGANQSTAILGTDELAARSNYFTGNDPAQWHTDVPNFARVKYESVYPGVDLVFYGNQRQLEYDFILAPGADPSAIRLAVDAGHQKSEIENRKSKQLKIQNAKWKIDPNGDLVTRTDGGQLVLRKPTVYQEDTRQSAIENRQFLEGHFALAADGSVRFEIPNYDKSKRLIIDPVLSYSTFLGGSGNDSAAGIAVDGAGSAYVVGQTFSANFPTASPYQSVCGGCTSNSTAFVTKFDGTGATLVYSTYLGGTTADSAAAVAVDSAGDAYVVGTTLSADFPTTAGTFQTACSSCGVGPSDAFVTKLNPTGSALVYSTYLGGSNSDQATGVAVWESSGNVYAYVTGITLSDDFPVASPLQNTCNGCDAGNSDAFITRLDPAGATLVYSTFLGGTGIDEGHAIAVDALGSAYVAGLTTSNDIRSVNAFQPFSGGNQDAFVTKLDPAGQTLAYFSYLGGSGNDQGNGIAVDSYGNAYVTGSTTSRDFPTVSPIMAKLPGGQAAFVTKVDQTGSTLDFSTYLGGSGTDSGAAIALDPAGNCYLTGATSSSDFPSVNPIPSTLSGVNQGTNGDAFVTKISSTGSAIIFSTYLGGSDVDVGAGIAVDSSGNAYVTGRTFSGNFPTANAFQANIGGQFDAFVAKLSGLALPTAMVAPSSLAFGNQAVNTASAAQTVTLTNNGDAALTVTSITAASTPASPAQFSETDTCDGSVAAGSNCTISVTFTPAASGPQIGTLTITDNASNSPETVTLTGTGTAPVAFLSFASINFGSQGMGTTSAAQTVTLTNTGNDTLSITSIAVGSGFAQTNTCGGSVAAGANCTINVTFSPTALGNVTGSLSITDDAAGSPQSVALSGTGVVAFSLTANPASQTVNKGTDSTTFTISAASQYGFTGAIALSCQNSLPGNCAFNPASITPGQSSTLTVSNLTPLSGDSLSFAVVGTNGSQTAQQPLQVLIPDFGVLVVPATATVTAGQSATYTLSVSPINSFNQQVNLTCSGAPATVSCAIQPSSVTLDGMTTLTATVTVTTTAQATKSGGARHRLPLPPTFTGPSFRWLLWLPLFGAASILAARRRARHRFAVSALFVLLCAACSVGGKATTGTPSGTYQMQIQGATANGSLTHTISIVLVVK